MPPPPRCRSMPVLRASPGRAAPPRTRRLKPPLAPNFLPLRTRRPLCPPPIRPCRPPRSHSPPPNPPPTRSPTRTPSAWRPAPRTSANLTSAQPSTTTCTSPACRPCWMPCWPMSTARWCRPSPGCWTPWRAAWSPWAARPSRLSRTRPTSARPPWPRRWRSAPAWSRTTRATPGAATA